MDLKKGEIMDQNEFIIDLIRLTQWNIVKASLDNIVETFANDDHDCKDGEILYKKIEKFKKWMEKESPIIMESN